MSEFERDPVTVREYRRTVAEVAEHQVVDQAEEVLTHAWIAELEQMRRAALQLSVAVRLAEHSARIELRDAQARGVPRDLAQAHAQVAESESAREANLEHARTLLASVDAELESVCQAGVDRSRRKQEDLSRLRLAWSAAYGAELGIDPGTDLS